MCLHSLIFAMVLGQYMGSKGGVGETYSSRFNMKRKLPRAFLGV